VSEAWIRVTTPELTMLAATLVLAVVHIFLPAAGRVARNGFRWAAGPRDTAPEKGVVTQRLERAQANLWETLPIFIGAVLIAHVSGEEGLLTFWGTQAYFWARLVYIPLYAFGSPLRPVAWFVSLGGLVAVLLALFI
jgi:uncharacterized MAPEG superfamily protein